MKNKRIAALLSLLFPGLGHLYLGKYVNAAIFIAGATALWYVMVIKGRYLFDILHSRFLLVAAALAFIYLYSTLHAYRQAK